jgi:fluoroquinolone resistance protein
MNKAYIEGKTFDKIIFSESPLATGEYENCIFQNCIMPGANLSGFQFSACVFKSCDLSNAVMRKTSWRDVKFTDCKLLGVQFGNCEKFLFSPSFTRCLLDLASFYKMNMKKGQFKECRLQEADFTECDLSGAVLDNCDLGRAIFFHTLLEKADLRSAYNYSIDPEQNSLKKAIFSREGIAGLLDKYNLDIV